MGNANSVRPWRTELKGQPEIQEGLAWMTVNLSLRHPRFLAHFCGRIVHGATYDSSTLIIIAGSNTIFMGHDSTPVTKNVFYRRVTRICCTEYPCGPRPSFSSRILALLSLEDQEP